ncbi:hypothetical protein [Streptomyces sp. NBC_00009]|uniref:hypothetical protein n=1 Tax=Streptomyces sp. NBC_00009 TaxID=2975620 RepID=UPI003253D776
MAWVTPAVPDMRRPVTQPSLATTTEPVPTAPSARCLGTWLWEPRPMTTTITTESVPAAQCGTTQPRERRR